MENEGPASLRLFSGLSAGFHRTASLWKRCAPLFSAIYSQNYTAHFRPCQGIFSRYATGTDRISHTRFADRKNSKPSRAIFPEATR